MAMPLLKSLWRYWSSLCVAFCTALVVLLFLAWALGGFDKNADAPNPAAACMDFGGTWDADARECRRAG
jgi:hypothetical protein